MFKLRRLVRGWGAFKGRKAEHRWCAGRGIMEQEDLNGLRMEQQDRQGVWGGKLTVITSSEKSI